MYDTHDIPASSLSRSGMSSSAGPKSNSDIALRTSAGVTVFPDLFIAWSCEAAAEVSHVRLDPHLGG